MISKSHFLFFVLLSSFVLASCNKNDDGGSGSVGTKSVLIGNWEIIANSLLFQSKVEYTLSGQELFEALDECTYKYEFMNNDEFVMSCYYEGELYDVDSARYIFNQADRSLKLIFENETDNLYVETLTSGKLVTIDPAVSITVDKTKEEVFGVHNGITIYRSKGSSNYSGYYYDESGKAYRVYLEYKGTGGRDDINNYYVGDASRQEFKRL